MMRSGITHKIALLLVLLGSWVVMQGSGNLSGSFAQAELSNFESTAEWLAQQPWWALQIPPRFWERVVQPLVELTVCPEGPPKCQYSKIQQAIDAAPETLPVFSWQGREQDPLKLPLIRVAAGTYAERLVIAKNVWLQGSVRESVIIKREERPENLVHPTLLAVGGYYIGALAVVIEGLTVHGGLRIMGDVTGFIVNSAFERGFAGIMATDARTHLLLYQNLVQNNGTGIGLLRVEELFSWEDGLWGSTHIMPLIRNIIRDNRRDPLGLGGWMGEGNGIEIRESAYSIVWGNEISRNEGYGLILSDGSGYLIDNLVEENGDGIYAEEAVDSVGPLQVINNTIKRNRGIGLNLRGGNVGYAYSAYKNVVWQNGEDGVVIGFGAQTKLSDNVIAHNKGSGLEAGRLEDILRCSGNRVFGNAKGDYTLLGRPSEELRRKCEGGQE